MSGGTRAVSADRRDAAGPNEVPVWSVANPDAAAADLERSAEAMGGDPDRGPIRVTLRPRSGFIVALGVFFLVQAANSWVSWHDAPIRTDEMVAAIVAYLGCTALVVPALVLRGRWRAVPVFVATLAGAVVPVVLSRDLMDVVGPRNVWVGQSLTLQVLFPLLIGLVATVAIVSAPRLPAKS